MYFIDIAAKLVQSETEWVESEWAEEEEEEEEEEQKEKERGDTGQEKYRGQ